MQGLTKMILLDADVRRMAASEDPWALTTKILALHRQYYDPTRDAFRWLYSCADLARTSWAMDTSTHTVLEGYLEYSSKKYAERALLQAGRSPSFSSQVTDSHFRVDHNPRLILKVHHGQYLPELAAAAMHGVTFVARHAPEDHIYHELLVALSRLGVHVIFGFNHAMRALSAGRDTILFIDSASFRDYRHNTILNLAGLPIAINARTFTLLRHAREIGVRIEAHAGSLTWTCNVDDAHVAFVAGILESVVIANPEQWDRIKYLMILNRLASSISTEIDSAKGE